MLSHHAPRSRSCCRGCTAAAAADCCRRSPPAYRLRTSFPLRTKIYCKSFYFFVSYFERRILPCAALQLLPRLVMAGQQGIVRDANGNASKVQRTPLDSLAACVLPATSHILLRCPCRALHLQVVFSFQGQRHEVHLPLLYLPPYRPADSKEARAWLWDEAQPVLLRLTGALLTWCRVALPSLPPLLLLSRPCSTHFAGLAMQQGVRAPASPAELCGAFGQLLRSCRRAWRGAMKARGCAERFLDPQASGW